MAQDPRDLINQNLNYIRGQGGALTDQTNQQAGNAEQLSGIYRNYLDPQYFNDAAGLGGYSPEEAQNIIQAGNTPTPLTADQAQSNFLTPQEQSQIQGNTDYYRPGYLESISRDTQQNLNNAIDPNALSVNPDYLQNESDVLNGGDTAVQQGLQQTAGNVRGAIDPTQLRQSQTAAQQETMSPEEQQNIVTAAGISAGVSNQAAVDALQRQAAAAGTNPQGVAAYRARMQRETAGQAADAETKARVQAQQARAQEALSSEQQRLGGEQYLTGTNVGAEEQLGQNLTAAQQQSINRRLGVQGQNEQLRLGSAQDIANRRAQAAQVGGQLGLQTGMFNEQAGQQAENTQAQRAAGVAQNRQQTGEYNQGTQFGQGLQQSNAFSGRYSGVANTRLGQENTARQGIQNQQQQQNQNAQNAYNRNVGIYGTETGAGNQAAGTYAGYQASQNAQPSWWQKAAGAVAGGAAAAGFAKGGVVTEPTEVTLAEGGEPELVMPIDTYRARWQQSESSAKPRKRGIYGEAA